MVRRIPGRLFPHTAIVSPCTGDTATGLAYDPPLPPRRANFNPLSARGTAGGLTASQTVDGVEVTASQVMLTDEMDLPVLSRVHASLDGRTYLVLSVRRWDHPQTQTFLEVFLGPAPAGSP